MSLQTLIDEFFETLLKHIWKVLLCNFCICMLVYNVLPLQQLAISFVCEAVKLLLLLGISFGFLAVLFVAHYHMKPDYEYVWVSLWYPLFYPPLYVMDTCIRYCRSKFHIFVPDGTRLDRNDQVLDDEYDE